MIITLNELLKNGISMEILMQLSYQSKLERSLVNSLHKFDKIMLFDEIRKVIRFYQECYILDEIDLDYRIKSEDSCDRKYQKFYPEMRLEKVFNDILGFRMLVDDYKLIMSEEIPSALRIVDMSNGKAGDDGYRGVHVYFQPNHTYYPIEIQINSYYDRQFNNWLHKYLYKKGYQNFIGNQLRKQYECGTIRREQEFEEVMHYVLSDSKKI